jgi:hypothetical protein
VHKRLVSLSINYSWASNAYCSVRLVSIYECHISNSQLDCPLSKEQSLSLGFGDGGTPPLTYRLPPGVNLNIGFLKLFVTTSPAVFGTISQMSPFGVPRGSVPRSIIINALAKQEIWDSDIVTIVLRNQRPTLAEHIPCNEFNPEYGPRINSLSQGQLTLTQFSSENKPNDSPAPVFYRRPQAPQVPHEAPHEAKSNLPHYPFLPPRPDWSAPWHAKHLLGVCQPTLVAPVIHLGGQHPGIDPVPPPEYYRKIFYRPTYVELAIPRPCQAREDITPQVGFDDSKHAFKTISKIDLSASDHLSSISVYYSDGSSTGPYGNKVSASQYVFILHPGMYILWCHIHILSELRGTYCPCNAWGRQRYKQYSVFDEHGPGIKESWWKRRSIASPEWRWRLSECYWRQLGELD